MRPADACPGVLRPHRAEDGAMVRLRLPGGRVRASTLRRLAELTVAYGNGILQLTSRAGLQLRGLPDPLPSELVTEVSALGLLPTRTHERVRNIVTSPLTGLSGGRADLTCLTAELDAALTAEPALAALPGRFLIVLDDGRGDVIDLRFDLAYRARGPAGGNVLVGSATRGLPVPAEHATRTLIRLALSFTEARAATGAWHVGELPEWLESLGLTTLPPGRGQLGIPLGRLGAAASVSVPLARLSPAQARLVEELADGRDVVVTPWRGLVLPTAAEQLTRLAAAGFVVDDESAWAQLSACVGAPACARSRIDTVRVAGALAATGADLSRTHVSGCERRCGAPSGEHVDLVAPTVENAVAVARDAR